MRPRRSGDLLDPAGVDALGADENLLRLAAQASSYSLQVGLPDPLGLIMRMTDIVSDRPSLATNCADSCHNYFLHILSMI